MPTLLSTKIILRKVKKLRNKA